MRDRSTRPELQPGTRVLARGDVWTVRSHTLHADCQALTLDGASSSNPAGERTLLLPFDRVVPVAVRLGASVVRPRAWTRAALAAVAHARPFGSLAAAADARIDVLPYQLEPALAMLRHGHTRVLLADDVGLGKTIQAGLLLAELSAAASTFRAIVLAPASLADQWTGELADRFALRAQKTDAAWLSQQARRLPADVNPWSLPGIHVASLDLVKRPEVLRSLEDVTWDTAVIDEAHTAGYATARLAAAHAVSLRSRRVLLLTATPPDGDPIQMAALSAIGAAGEPLVQFRRSRADAGQQLQRRTVLLAIRLTAAERRMHRTLARYTEAVWKESATPDSGARLATTVLRKRALSSAVSLAASVRRRMALLAGAAASQQEWQMSLPLGDDESIEDAVHDSDLGSPGLRDAAREAAMLVEVARRADVAAGYESKLGTLLRFLRRARQPAIVFTEYRDTLSVLDAALRQAGQVTIQLHGGMSASERAEAIREFGERDLVLLATDAASEGLNLQKRCRLVIHFELPWTPARLEQRTGRVDRLGQVRRVHEVIFAARDTAERMVLAPLARRARLAASAGRSSALLAVTESAVAAGVILGHQVPLPEWPRQPGPSCIRLVIEGDDEGRRIMSVRRLRALAGRLPRSSAVAAFARRKDRNSELTIIVEIRLADATGSAIHSELVALRARPTASVGRKWKDLRSHVASLMTTAPWTAIEAVAQQSSAGSLATAARQHALVVMRLQGRDHAMRQALPSAARSLVQAGLFDNRALRKRETEKKRATVLVEDSDARSEAIAAVLRVAQTISLVAVRVATGGG